MFLAKTQIAYISCFNVVNLNLEFNWQCLNFVLVKKKNLVCQTDSYSLDTDITIFIFDFIGNVYLPDYKIM